MTKRFIIAMVVLCLALAGGTAFVVAQGGGRDASGVCTGAEDGGLDCDIHIAPPGSSPDGVCLPQGIMTHNEVHDDITVWYADTETGPRPIGYSTDSSCIHPY